VISASRRTDIPAWYSEWFGQRMRAGFCMVRNPFRPSQVRRVSLRPEDVAAIVFWTRWPTPLMEHLEELDRLGFAYVFQVTLTGLGEPLEPHPRSHAERLAAILALSDRIGPARVWWRYDPIVLGERFDAAFHLATFESLAKQLAGRCSRVTLSLIDWYRKTERRVAAMAGCGCVHRLAPTAPEALDLVRRLVDIARGLGLRPVACCEPAWVAGSSYAGASQPRSAVNLLEPAACIDAAELGRLFGLPLAAGRDPGQRPDCRCSPSIDIGAAHTCIGGCAYCYSTSSHEQALRAFRTHDPKSEFLHG
jgi:hypothetical protein